MLTILPKFHLNRHTPRAILFAGPRFGGLNIPDTYTDLGYGHLQYLVGHIKLGDEVGRLLLSLITHTQLHVGSTTPFFQLQYPSYSTWIDQTWLTDCWKFLHRAKVTVEIESQWVPSLVRQGDITLMDLALTFNLDSYQLRCINTCRLYLQVITVSDITTARGDKLLPCIPVGEKDPHHTSVLLWPNIPRPPQSFWNIWYTFLQFFTRGRKLMTSLGQWTMIPHQAWEWFSDIHHTVWERIDDDTWKKYTAIAPTRRQTRHSHRKYITGVIVPPPEKDLLYPATIESQHSDYFTVSISPTPFREPDPPTIPDLWRHAPPPAALENTPPFFQHLISTPPTAQECQDIAQELTEKTLLACSDGACDPVRAVSSHGVVFSSSLMKQRISSMVGPIDGHPDLVTSYRAELSGIVATLYLIYRLCQFYKISEGAMTLYCDNKAALANAFKTIKPGITPYLTTDHDLVELAQALIHIIPIMITTEWVKGHYTGNDRQYQHDLNEEADKIAGQYQLDQSPHFTIRKPLPPPGYKIRLLHDSSVLSAKVHSMIVNSLHNPHLEAHIIRKT